MGIGGWIFLAVVAALVIGMSATLNGLVTVRNRFLNAFSQIDVQLKRRYDLIPNLVETAKGYMAHERQTLDAVIAARSGAVQAAQRAAGAPGGAEAMRGLAQAEAGLAGAPGRRSAGGAAHPPLTADANMRGTPE